MRNTFIATLVEEAGKDQDIFLLTPDLGYSVLEPFQQRYPDRFLNVGIAEQNAVGLAAGLALSGKKVYVYSIVPFVTMRCFEQVRVDVAYMNTNVRLIGVGAGFSYGPAGATHHAVEDISIMRSLPNMTVCCPGDPIEVRELVRRSVDHQGPMYIRLGKSGEPLIHDPGLQLEIGQSVEVKAGRDVLIATTSNMLEQGKWWADRWEADGISAGLLSVPTIKPLDPVILMRYITAGIPILTLEEHSIIGGLGSAVAELIAESGYAVKFRRVGMWDEYSHTVGGQQYLRNKLIMEKFSLDSFLGTHKSKAKR
jgi:transketolase